MSKIVIVVSGVFLVVLGCAHTPSGSTEGLKICSGNLSAVRLGETFHRKVVKSCVSDTSEGVSVKVLEEAGDGTLVPIPLTEAKKLSSSGDTLSYSAKHLANGAETILELALTPKRTIRNEGAMAHHFEGSLTIRRKLAGQAKFGEPLRLGGLHFYTETPASHMHWGYHGEVGPDRWGALQREYEVCGSGTHQSPIDILRKEAKKSSLGNLQFRYKPSRISQVNNGHALQANVESGNWLEVGGKTYELLQFHVHAPSEHFIDGKSFDMEIHFVHQAPDKSLAVVGVMVNAIPNAKESALVSRMLLEFPSRLNDPKEFSQLFVSSRLLPQKRAYFSYPGSLTTPPCSESVTWFVLDEVLPITPSQLAAVKRILGGENARRLTPSSPGRAPVPARHDRVIVRGK